MSILHSLWYLQVLSSGYGWEVNEVGNWALEQTLIREKTTSDLILSQTQKTKILDFLTGRAEMLKVVYAPKQNFLPAHTDM